LNEEEAHAALIRRIAEHADRAAFAALFAHFAPRVKAYMRRLGAADAQAEDMAQEALFAVWRKASLFDPARAGAATWVFTIARNLRIDTLRRERPTEALPPDTERREIEEAPGAEAELIIAERDRSLRAALTVLPPEQAQLVQLAFYEDRPHREIERVLGIPLGTVKSRLRMALQRLRGALQETRGEAPEKDRRAALEDRL
jgi:RNA polymerase sigma-70 factor (ECF subfamily)